MSDRRKIVYITGTRADFGLMLSTLQRIHAHPGLELSLIVTGMHLSSDHGMTVAEVEASGLPIAARIEVEQGPASGALMGSNVGLMTSGMVAALAEIRPDTVLLLGDRGEMLAGAIAALHLNIPSAHIHGGERSGTIDEPVRHAISKLSHLHLVATEESRERLIRMGEAESNVFVVGAPGLDGITTLAREDAGPLLTRLGLKPGPLVLLVYHPVVQEAASAAATARVVLDVVSGTKLQVLALAPNSDAGGAEIWKVLEEAAALGRITLVTHLKREDFLTLVRHADALIGNSSSGIIEAASFGTKVLNIGSRQRLRQRNHNVVDVEAETGAIKAALEALLAAPRPAADNIYGDGRAAERIAAILATQSLDSTLLMKTNAY
jgi:GDP/UDP-N,N'-diacetylbacillosamine 2-epimerase (hydrolysing)